MRLDQKELDKFQENMSDIALLSNPVRQKIVFILSQSHPKGLSVNDVTRQLGISQPATSIHLKQLKQGGIVGSQRIHNTHIYFLTVSDLTKRLEELLKILRQLQ